MKPVSSSSAMPFVIAGTIALLLFVVAITFFRGTDSANVITDGIQEDSTSSKDLPNIASYEEIGAEELKQLLHTDSDSVAVLDLRIVDRYEREHIIHSINFPIQSLLEGGIAPNYHKKTVVVIADHVSAKSIAQAVDIIKNNNSTVKVLTGGMAFWKNAGGLTISIGDPNSIIDKSKVQYISFDKILDILAQDTPEAKYGYIIVDIRPESEFNRGHLPGAINVPLAKLEYDNSKLSYIKNIIVYGDSIMDSFQGGVRLHDLLYLKTYTMDGGYLDWVKAENPIVK